MGECATADEGAAKIFPEKLAKIIEDGDYSAEIKCLTLMKQDFIGKDCLTVLTSQRMKTASGHKENLTVDGVVGLKGDNDGEEKSTPSLEN
ncbi:hypothetical protein TNCV_2697341 [Trichonephila clavipes]|nr:hypothetical protein TNCV_2697341 [Trichonephila clavipes]